jgi:TonB family protein
MALVRGATVAMVALSPLLLASQLNGSTDVNRRASPSSSPLSRCEAEARQTFDEQAWTTPIQLSGLKRASGRLPDYPDLPAGTRGSGTAIHELLIRPDGRVQRVWTIREPSLRPPFPAFGQAITDALQQWRYEPLIVEGRAVPVCLIFTTTIHWR